MIKNRIILTLGLFAGCFYLAQAKDQPLKIGYANMEYVLSLLPETKKFESDYKIFEQQLKNDLIKQAEQFQDKLQAFQKGEKTMSEAVRKQKETELQQMQMKFQKLEMEAQDSLTHKQIELLQPIYDKVQKAVQSVAEAEGYTHILNRDAGGLSVILYADKKYDVSELVLKKLGVNAPKEGDKKKTQTSTKK